MKYIISLLVIGLLGCSSPGLEVEEAFEKKSVAVHLSEGVSDSWTYDGYAWFQNSADNKGEVVFEIDPPDDVLIVSVTAYVNGGRPFDRKDVPEYMPEIMFVSYTWSSKGTEVIRTQVDNSDLSLYRTDHDIKLPLSEWTTSNRRVFISISGEFGEGAIDGALGLFAIEYEWMK